MDQNIYGQKSGYRCANGNPCWNFAGKDIEAIACEDLLWRKIQTNPDLLQKILKELFPSSYHRQAEVILDRLTRISLMPDSCGAYSTPSAHRMCILKKQVRDAGIIKKSLHNFDLQECFLGPLIQARLGLTPESVILKLSHVGGITLSPQQRYLFEKKACHRRILMSPKDLEKAHNATFQFYPTVCGFEPVRSFWYTTENGSIEFGVTYFKNKLGSIVRVPVSAWEYAGRGRTKVVFDAIHPERNFPMFNLAEVIHQRDQVKYALIFPNEITANIIKEKHGYLAQWFVTTTYSSIEGTEWKGLGTLRPIIVPDPTPCGCNVAFKLHAALEKQGFTASFAKREKAAQRDELALAKDLARNLLLTTDDYFLPEFAAFACSEYGVEPPEGVLPKGQSLLAMKENDNEPELLLADLLNFGDLMMIFAWRGIGKSLLGFILALCFASGTKACNGRICPTRKYKVLVIDGEMSAHSLRQRALALCRGLDLPESAVGDVRVRSSIIEGKDLQLDTDSGWKDLVPDMIWAEIIIIDSLFKIFPTTMSPEFTATKPLNVFCSWCRQYGKTTIVIDHQGKSATTAFGSMGKDIGLDAVLHLKTVDKMRQAVITKNRNFPSDSGCWLRFNITSNDQGNSISFDVTEPATNGAARSGKKPAPPEDAAGICHKTTSITKIEEAIINYIKEHPEQIQGVIVNKLSKLGLGGRSKLHAQIKVLLEASQLTFWKNAPKRGQTERPDSLASEEER